MTNTKSKLQKYSILEIVGAVVALSGFIAALVWFLGFSFNKGYYSAFGVLSDIGNKSIYEITSIGSLPFLIFVLLSGVVIVSGITIFSENNPVSRVEKFFETHLFSRFSPMLRRNLSYLFLVLLLSLLGIALLPSFSLDLMGMRPPFLVVCLLILTLVLIRLLHQWQINTRPSDYYVFAYVAMMVMLLYIVMLIWSSGWGYFRGCQDTVRVSDLYTIFASNPLPLENAKVQNNIFVYSGYHGFTGNEYLVLYNKLDSKKNLPERVYFIKKSAISGYSVETSQPTLAEVRKTINSCKKIIVADMMIRRDLANFTFLNLWTK
jgi:hypothetical protein